MLDFREINKTKEGGMETSYFRLRRRKERVFSFLMFQFARCQELKSCLNKILFFQDLCLSAVEATREDFCQIQ